MKSILIRTLTGAIAVTLTLATPTVAGAQTPDQEPMFDSLFGRPGIPARLLGPLFPILRRLELTADERQQIRAILQGHRDDFRALIRRAMDARRPLFAAVYLDPFDEAAIRDRSANVAAVEADEAVLRATIRTQIFDVLTPDQQSRAIELLKRFVQERRRDDGSSPF
jgi:Spy/CpxP family protein refolding chaperone